MPAAHPASDRSERAAERWIEWTLDKFGDRAAFASSFGAEDMVLLDLIARGQRSRPRTIRVITLDTGRLFPETYDLIEEARRQYQIPIEIFAPDQAELEALVSRGGPNLFYASIEQRKACCVVRKVHPLERALRGAELWITGLRREQSFERSTVEVLAKDPAHGGRWKLAPLAEWSWEDVLSYADRHSVPLNRLHARGFPSVGCAPCTRAVRPGEDPRSGRWWWERGSKECGLHSSELEPEILVPALGATSAGWANPSLRPEVGASAPPSPRRSTLARDVLIL